MNIKTTIQILINSWLLGKKKTKLEQKYNIPKKSSLGQGGNGVVRKVLRKSDGQMFALKILDTSLRHNREKCLRFIDEIKTIVACQDIEGVVPVIDYSEEELWYIMPLAEKIDHHIQTFEDKIKCVKQIAEILVALHTRGYSHRDVKPENILFYEGRFFLCDFGLVDIPDNPNNLTKNSSRIGPMSTIAPEMKRNAKEADGKKADVYSLAKTLWILLSGKTKGFEGVYNSDDEDIALGLCPLVKGQHLVEIEEVLERATNNNPEKRPTMLNFLQELIKWEDTRHDEFKKSQSNWHFLIKRIFKDSSVPGYANWEGAAVIKDVLKKVVHLPVMSYLFFPDGGDLDLKDIEIVEGQECLDVITNFGVYRVKPKSLRFDNFQISAWNYFLLDLDDQELVVGDASDEYSEEVVEDSLGHYVSAKDFVYGVYDYDSGVKLPVNAKKITRYLKGKFLIVLKLGPYNAIRQVTDGRHNNCSAEQFRDYIKSLEIAYQMKQNMSRNVWNVLYYYLVDNCPFKPETSFSTLFGEQQNYESDFVQKHWSEFDFMDIVGYASQKNESSLIEFIFYLKNTGFIDSLDLFDNKERFLCSNGRLQFCAPTDERVLKVYDDAESFYLQIQAKLKGFLSGKVAAIEASYFGVMLTKVGKPQHLFTVDEIKKLMLAADDRVNNILVINGNGYAKIIQDLNSRSLYPVINETWVAYNNYVGKYSRLPDLETAYHYCLAKWYLYLKEGVGQPMDDYDDCLLSNEELLEKINDYYR